MQRKYYLVDWRAQGPSQEYEAADLKGLKELARAKGLGAEVEALGQGWKWTPGRKHIDVLDNWKLDVKKLTDGVYFHKLTIWEK